MEKFKVKKKHLTGEIADFPLRVVQAMVDEQVRQGNKANPSVFATNIWKGFQWSNSEQGGDFWHDAIINRQFHLIPEPEKPKGHVHAKLMKYWNLYNNEWICLLAGMIIGGALVMFGFWLART